MIQGPISLGAMVRHIRTGNHYTVTGNGMMKDSVKGWVPCIHYKGVVASYTRDETTFRHSFVIDVIKPIIQDSLDFSD